MAFGIDMGPSSQEGSQYNNLTASSGFATGLGENDLTQSSQFFSDILSGDPTRTAKALAPQINAIQARTQQEKDSLAQFSPRSGGTAATVANLDTAGRGAVTDLTGQLTGGAASALGSQGTSLLGMGMSGQEAGFGEAEEMQKQRAAKWNDIIQSIAATAGAVAGMPGISGTKLSTSLDSFNTQFGA